MTQEQNIPLNIILNNIKDNPGIFTANLNSGQTLSISTFKLFKRELEPMEQHTDRYVNNFFKWVNSTISVDKINELNSYLKSVNPSVGDIITEYIHLNNDFICNAYHQCVNSKLSENLSKFLLCEITFKIGTDFKDKLYLKIVSTVLMLDESYNVYTLEELNHDISKADNADLIAVGPMCNFSTVVF